MATSLDTERPAVQRPEQVSAERHIPPVKIWAFIGALIVPFIGYLYASWFWTGEATPTPTGPDPVPTKMVWAVHTMEVVFFGGALFLLYWFLIRPWRQERRLTNDGMLVIGLFLLWWQDVLVNYVAPFCTINAEFLNLGSWTSRIPGVLTPNAHLLVEPLLWDAGGYLSLVFAASVVGCAIMRKAKSRWPGLSSLGVISVCLVVFFIGDLIMEIVFLRLGMYTYVGGVDALSLFDDKHYKTPVYEMFLFALSLTVFAALRYYRNDRGLTVAEKGADDLRCSTKQRTWIRLLAIIGWTQVLYLATYATPLNIINLHAGPWPEDVQKRSYLTNGLCGPGTSYACPGASIPLNRPDSVHVSPSGELVRSGEDGRYRPLDTGRGQ